MWEDALALPAEEREALARVLLDSIEAAGGHSDDPALITELERRARAVADGTAELLDWSTVREAVRAKWRAGAGRADQGR